MKKNYLITAAAALFTSGTVSAAITYVDADVAGNTTLADGTALVSGSIGYDTDAAADGLWRLRAFGNGSGGSILEGGSGEDVPRLRTTISGLTAGDSYNIYAYFWGAGNTQTWRGRVSLTDEAGDLPGYNTVHFAASSFSAMTYLTSPSAGTENPGPLSTADVDGLENGGYFSNSVLTEEDDRRLYEVSLGTVVVDGTGSVSVYIDDLANTSTANRTWYDGVGFEAIPEPSTGLLGLLGLLTFARRRR